MPAASGTMMPEAVTVATVAEPVARRMSTATSQPAISGFMADSVMELAITSPMPESTSVCLKPPPAATIRMMPATEPKDCPTMPLTASRENFCM